MDAEDLRSSPHDGSTPRHSGPELRQDAQRNRDRIIDAALEIFASTRALGTLERVSVVAGVGKGTVYRHFANREALMAEVAAHQFTQLRIRAESALDGTDEVGAFVSLVHDILQYNRDRGLYLEVVRAGSMPGHLVEAQARMRVPLALAMDRCRSHGVIAPEVRPDDLFVLIGGCSMRLSVVDAPGEDWERALALILRALGFPADQISARIAALPPPWFTRDE